LRGELVSFTCAIENVDSKQLQFEHSSLPEKWLAELELRAEIEAVAGDLLKRSEDTDAWRRRYPAA
ncbi:MAG TPA: hypothetical protein VFY40_14350, partial [Blastocatellia bacterium]|nr:hypothetical protein [Blastocatellia bacterium]